MLPHPHPHPQPPPPDSSGVPHNPPTHSPGAWARAGTANIKATIATSATKIFFPMTDLLSLLACLRKEGANFRFDKQLIE
jgi:hypothetical protein